MIILASASPRRKELLALITDRFSVIPSMTDENTDLKDARELVRFLACKKARGVARDHPADAVIGADTVVAAKGEILGKPRNREDAARMIRLLENDTHTVWTGVCLISGGTEWVEDCATDVTFGPVAPDELELYLDREQVGDKAGAYAIQGGAAKFIDRIDGCFFNVVGLPVSLVYRMLKKAGIA